MSVGTKKRERIIKNGRNRASRPKSFKTPEAALTYAKAQGMKDASVKKLSEQKYTIAA